MKTPFKSIMGASLVAVLSASAYAAPAASAQTRPSAYWLDTQGNIVRNAYGQCWRAGYWTPADAIPECEGGKPAAAAKAPVAAAVAAPAPQKIVFDADSLFDFDKAVLKPAAKSRLDRLSQDVKGKDIKSITIVGHTDSKGSDAYNQKLSERRAAAVKTYLVSKGVDGKKITTKGMGKKQPVASNKTEAGRAKNRRVTIEAVGTAK